jgi:hypothetical protein
LLRVQEVASSILASPLGVASLFLFLFLVSFLCLRAAECLVWRRAVVQALCSNFFCFFTIGVLKKERAHSAGRTCFLMAEWMDEGAKKESQAGLEPAISASGGQRLIH